MHLSTPHDESSEERSITLYPLSVSVLVYLFCFFLCEECVYVHRNMNSSKDYQMIYQLSSWSPHHRVSTGQTNNYPSICSTNVKDLPHFHVPAIRNSTNSSSIFQGLHFGKNLECKLVHHLGIFNQVLTISFL